MEIQVSSSSSADCVRYKRKTLKTVLERALESLTSSNDLIDYDDHSKAADAISMEEDGGEPSRHSSIDSSADREVHELCNLLQSRVECADFIEKLEHAHVSGPRNIVEEGSSLDMVNDNELWEGDFDKEDYVVVRQEEIVDDIASFMAAYLLSLKHTKELTPNQLKDALAKTFSMKKKKGKLRKAWDGSKVVYNVASWSATAIGIYQNPALVRVASKAFWTSCHVISKLL